MIKNAAVEKKIMEIVIEILGIRIRNDNKKITREDCSEWDSMNHLKIILSIEDTFGFKFQDNEIMNVRSTEDIKIIVEKRGKQNGFY